MEQAWPDDKNHSVPLHLSLLFGWKGSWIPEERPSDSPGNTQPFKILTLLLLLHYIQWALVTWSKKKKKPIYLLIYLTKIQKQSLKIQVHWKTQHKPTVIIFCITLSVSHVVVEDLWPTLLSSMASGFFLGLQELVHAALSWSHCSFLIHLRCGLWEDRCSTLTLFFMSRSVVD